MVLTLLAERRKPSGECRLKVAKPEGSRPAATNAKSKVSAIWLAPCRSQVTLILNAISAVQDLF